MYFQRLPSSKRLHGQTNGPIQDAVDDVKGLALQAQPTAVGEIVDAGAQDVVLRNNLCDIKPVFYTLQAMGGRAAFDERFRDRLVGSSLQRGGQFHQELRDVIVERRRVEVSCRRKLPHLQSPPRKQGGALLLDERGEDIEIVDRHFISNFVPDVSRLYGGARDGPA